MAREGRKGGVCKVLMTALIWIRLGGSQKLQQYCPESGDATTAAAATTTTTTTTTTKDER